LYVSAERSPTSATRALEQFGFCSALKAKTTDQGKTILYFVRICSSTAESM